MSLTPLPRDSSLYTCFTVFIRRYWKKHRYGSAVSCCSSLSYKGFRKPPAWFAVMGDYLIRIDHSRRLSLSTAEAAQYIRVWNKTSRTGFFNMGYSQQSLGSVVYTLKTRAQEAIRSMLGTNKLQPHFSWAWIDSRISIRRPVRIQQRLQRAIQQGVQEKGGSGSCS